MPKALNQEQIERFRLNGFLVVENVLSAAELDALDRHCDFIASGKAEHISDTSIQLEPVFREGKRPVEDRVLAVRKLYDLAVYDEIMWAHAINPKIVDIIADLLGTEDIKLYGDQLFMKPPKTGSAFSWHQDSSDGWRDIFPMDLVSAWTAIDDATVENGCLNFAPGTHRWGMIRAASEIASLATTCSRLSKQSIIDDLETRRWPVETVPLARGSISFHHSLVFHQSNANLSGKRRRGYATHYMRATSIKDETITDAPKRPSFKQVRGRSFPGRV